MWVTPNYGKVGEWFKPVVLRLHYYYYFRKERGFEPHPYHCLFFLVSFFFYFLYN